MSENINTMTGQNEKKRFRLLTEEEMQQWTKAIHEACTSSWVPALRAAYSHLTPFVDETCPTAYTDCSYRIGLSPDVLNPSKTSLEQLTMIMLHETLHNTQHHRQRVLEGKDVSKTLVNYATDLEINSIIAEGVLGIDLAKGPALGNGRWESLYGDFHQISADEARELNSLKNSAGKPALKKKLSEGDWWYTGGLFPAIGIFHKMPVGLTAEQYMGLLREEDEQFNENISVSIPEQNGNKESESGENTADNSKNGTGNSNVSNNSRGNAGSSTATSNEGENGSSNIGISGTIKTIYVDNGDGTATKVGENIIVDDITIKPNDPIWDEVSKLGINPISQSEEQTVNDQIRHDIQQSHTKGYGTERGNMLLNYVDKGLRPPIVDWKKILRHTTSNACQQKRKGRDDYTYTRRSRRYSQGRFVFPGMISYVPKIRFAIDTSGSMGTNEFRSALSEIEGVLRMTKGTLECVCVDTYASDVRKVKSVKEITEKMVGGGGTDMGAALTQVANEKPRERPDILVIATDGYYDWQSFCEKLENQELKKITPIIIIVSNFDENTYFSNLNRTSDYNNLVRQHHPKAQVIAAYTK